MKNFTLLLLFSFLFLFASCSKETTEIYIVENVTVEFCASSVFNVEQEEFGTRAATDELNYAHMYPASYKAYFISQENKGDYSVGDVVKTLEVYPNSQTITVPKLKYKVYVTNYEKSGVWYTWSDALAQLPQSSNDLYLYGSNEIDYSTQITGTVEVKNPYAAVFIKTDARIQGSPKHYTSGSDYIKVDYDVWWLKYVRAFPEDGVSVNTGVVVKFNNQSWTNTITLTDMVEANKVYKYILNDGVEDTNSENNFNVVVEKFGDTIEREINIL